MVGDPAALESRRRACGRALAPPDDWQAADRIRRSIRTPTIPDRTFNLTHFGAVGEFDGLIELFNSERGESVDSIVLDDGFQHRKIARGLDVVLIEIEDRPAREWAFIPAILLLLTVGALQRRRTVAGPV